MADQLVLIPFNGHLLALTLEEYQAALVKGQQLTGEAVTPPTSPPEPWLTAEQMAEQTGIPASWFLDQARQGKLPHVKAGKYVRFTLSAIQAELEVLPARHAALRADGRVNSLKKQVFRKAATTLLPTQRRP